MATITLKLDKKDIISLEKSLVNFTKRPTPPYALYQYKNSDVVITAYESLKVVFQGNDLEVYASKYMNNVVKSTINTTINDNSNKQLQFPQAGSDEVGTGDYFGPVVVCACIINEQDYQFLKDLKVNDSKQVTDSLILQIAPTIMKRITYSLLILDNNKYNVVQKDNNLNAIKAKLHNQAYYNLYKKFNNLPKLCIVDQFATPKNYYNYLKDETNVIDHIHFETKAESKYISVATASIIARYAFLVQMDKMSNKYCLTFPKGGGDIVNKFIKRFVDSYGEEELSNVAKLHFKNTTKYKEI